MRVGLLGDVHGNADWLMHAVEVFHGLGLDTIIQVGDLGVWPGEAAARTFNNAHKALVRNGQQMLVAPGNHEDYDRIDKLKPRADGWLRFRPTILLAPRGHRTVMSGVSFLWLGGAGSVDRHVRVEEDQRERRNQLAAGQKPIAKSWWPQESITDEDVKASTSGGHVDVMVCHDAPHGVKPIDRLAQDIRTDFLSIDITYAEESRARLTTVVDSVTPNLLLHGHYHFPVDEIRHNPDGSTTRVFGLSRDNDPASLGTLDLPSLKVSLLG